mmetsp:Transcript_22741/g.49823  ORF Transcript_22741/g.49823 Transcript_22741/m.49823 type:complete len:242 (+) Transcript_22741:1313-2038(+)
MVHPHAFHRPLLEKGQLPGLGHIAPDTSCIIKEPVVNLLNDLQMPRQHTPHHLHWAPVLGLGLHGEGRVEEELAHHSPGLIPGQHLHINQEPHELGDGQRRLALVQLDAYHLGHSCPGSLGMFGTVGVQDILNTGGTKEILLPQSHLRRIAAGCVDIPHPLGHFQGTQHPGFTEILKADLLGALSHPPSKGDHVGGAAPRHGRILGGGHRGIARHPPDAHVTAVVIVHLGSPTEVHAVLLV